MIANLIPYPKMKNSGIEWLGVVPKHWGVRRVRTIAAVVNGATPSSNVSSYWGGNIVWVTPQDLGALASRHVKTSARTITRDGYESCGATMVPAGSVVISTRAPIGHTAIVNVEACTNQGCRVLIPNDSIQSDYLFYSLKAARPELESLGQGTTFAELSRDELCGFPLSFPPLPEQTAIVRFLDHADRRIRRYIRAKQKLITLLKEQKQAIIHQAVTGQVDVRTGQPYPAYKPSGVEWLGEVPKHWEVCPAKGHFQETDERSETGSEELLSVSHITGVTPRSEKNITMFKASSNVGHKLCRPGDLVINTMWAWMAALGVASRAGIVSPSYAVYRPHRSSRLLGEFADLLLRTAPYKSEYICRSAGIRSSRLRLYPEEFLRIKLLCPPPEEQRSIVEVVSKKATDTRRAIDLAYGELSLLREYRTRLITDVVTGKLDVREAAAQLPDEVKELEPLDEAEVLINGEEEPSDGLGTTPEEAAV